jgi:hypothetical protein
MPWFFKLALLEILVTKYVLTDKVNVKCDEAGAENMCQFCNRERGGKKDRKID